MKRLVLIGTAIGLTMLSASAAAQSLRRCFIDGNVVIQEGRCPEPTPEAKDEKVKARYAVPSAGGSTSDESSGADSSNPIALGKALCRSMAPSAVRWKDPGSLMVGTPSGGKMEVVDVNGASMGARVFLVPVNGKNSYGGYTGEKSLMCYTSQDGRRMLKIDEILL